MADDNKRSFTTRQMHVLFVYNDPDFVADFNQILEKSEKTLQEALLLNKIDTATKILTPLMKKWCLSLEDIRTYLNRLPDEDVAEIVEREPTYMLSPDIYIDNDDYNERLRFSTLVFDIDRIQKQDFLEIWDKISEQQAKRNKIKSRNRTAVDYELVYAVFKQRQQNPAPTYVEIFDMYAQGRLPEYAKKPSLSGDRDVEWLQKLYYRYRPSTEAQKNESIKEYYLSMRAGMQVDSDFDEIVEKYERKKRTLGDSQVD